MRSKSIVVILYLCVAVVLAGCLPSVARTEHDFILARMSSSGAPVKLADDDPLYDLFQQQVLSNAYLRELLTVLDNTTEAFLATNIPQPAPQTVANRLLIVLEQGTPAPTGVLHHVKLEIDGARVPIELALDLHLGDISADGGTSADWTAVRQQFVRGMAHLLLELVGWDTNGKAGALPDTPIDAPTTPPQALTVGFEAALQALDAQRNPALLAALKAKPALSPQERELLLCYEAVPRDELRARAIDGAPNGAPEEALRTPEMVASFFFRLLQTTGDYYHQRDLLWFVNYDPGQIPYAKILLAFNRMPRHKQGSLETFIQAYQETFPGDKEAVSALVAQVFGFAQGHPAELAGSPTPGAR